MRIVDKEGAIYLAAKEAARSLITCLREELEPFLFECAETRRYETSYFGVGYWMPHLDREGIYYGREDGLYLLVCNGEGYVWFPKSSDAFHNLLSSMVKLHDEDDDLYGSSLADDISIKFDGDSKAEFTIYCYVRNRNDKEEYNSAKFIASELMEMVEDMDGLTEVTPFEGDDEGDTSEEKEHDNYYVGFQFTCDAFLR